MKKNVLAGHFPYLPYENKPSVASLTSYAGHTDMDMDEPRLRTSPQAMPLLSSVAPGLSAALGWSAARSQSPESQYVTVEEQRGSAHQHIIWWYVMLCFSVGICFFSQSARVKTDCGHGESSSAVRTSQDRSHASAVRAFSKVFSSSEILVPCRAWRCLEARRDTAIAGRQTGGWAIGIMDFSKLWPSTPHVRPPGTKESATSVTAWMELRNSAVDGMLRYTAKKREMSKTSWWIQKIIQNRKIQVGKFQCAHDHSS